MKYRREIYQKVNKKLENSRKKAELKSLRFKESIFKKIPRLGEIERELTSNSLKLVKNIFAQHNIVKKKDENKVISENFVEIASKIKLKNDALNKEFSEILSENGLSLEDLEPNYNCKKCKDTGIFNGNECECKKNLLLKEVTIELNKLSAFELCTFESFSLEYYSNRPNVSGKVPRDVMSRVFNNCYTYAKNFEKKSNNMLFFGENGLGKTHLSLAIAHEVIKKGFNVIYATVQEIVKKCESEKFFHKDEVGEETECFLECDLLIMDDLGAEFKTSFSKSAIYDIVNSRLLRRKKTVINTNMTMAEIENTYSKRFTSRIIGHYYRIEFCGNDIRSRVLSIV